MKYYSILDLCRKTCDEVWQIAEDFGIDKTKKDKQTLKNKQSLMYEILDAQARQINEK